MTIPFNKLHEQKQQEYVHQLGLTGDLDGWKSLVNPSTDFKGQYFTASDYLLDGACIGNQVNIANHFLENAMPDHRYCGNAFNKPRDQKLKHLFCRAFKYGSVTILNWFVQANKTTAEEMVKYLMGDTTLKNFGPLGDCFITPNGVESLKWADTNDLGQVWLWPRITNGTYHMYLSKAICDTYDKGVLRDECLSFIKSKGVVLFFMSNKRAHLHCMSLSRSYSKLIGQLNRLGFWETAAPDNRCDGNGDIGYTFSGTIPRTKVIERMKATLKDNKLDLDELETQVKFLHVATGQTDEDGRRTAIVADIIKDLIEKKAQLVSNLV